MKTLDQLFAEDVDRLLEAERIKIEAETAKWNALPQSEKDRITAEQVSLFADIPEIDDEEEEEDEQE
jgi:hypothetical protein